MSDRIGLCNSSRSDPLAFLKLVYTIPQHFCCLYTPHTPSAESGDLTVNLLYQKLFSVRAKWYSVGLTLGLLPPTLHAIEREHSINTDRCIAAVCEKWVAAKPEATWDDVLEMLESPSLDEKALAKEIRQQM